MISRLIFELSYLLSPIPWDACISSPEQMTPLEIHPSGRALDLMCGTRTNLGIMAQADWQMTGVNLTGRAIHQARPKAYLAGIWQGTDRYRVSACFSFRWKI